MKNGKEENAIPGFTKTETIILTNQLALMVCLFASDAITDAGKAALQERLICTFRCLGIDPYPDNGVIQ